MTTSPSEPAGEPSAPAKVRRGRGPFFAAVPWELQDCTQSWCRECGSLLPLDHCEPGHHAVRAVDAGTIAAYAALRRYADFGGTTGARAAHVTLASKAGLGERALRDRVQRLAALGWVDWVSGKSAGTPNEYVVNGSLDVESSGGGSALGADQGRRLMPTPSAPPADQGRHDVPTTESHGPRANTEGAPEPIVTWVTPYWDTHLEIAGGKLPKRAFRALKELHDAYGVLLVEARQRVYLMKLMSEGRLEFFDYEKFSSTFAQWDASALLASRVMKSRPTASGGKDYLK